MTTDTALRILSYLRTNKQAKVVDMVRDIRITQAAIHRQLNKLLARGEIMKVGKPPVVFYLLNAREEQKTTAIPEEIQAFINATYCYVSPVGEYLIGTEGFSRWVAAIHQEKQLLALAKEYVKVRKEADAHIRSEGWIDATKAKEQSTFGDRVVDKLLYKDFYSIEKFGKTKLGQQVLYAKSSQNSAMIDALVLQLKPVLEKIIHVYGIDTIAYVPPSVKRNLQLMTELKRRLQLSLPEIMLVKAYVGDIIVSQKSLSKLEERVMNAQQTIFIDVNKSARHPRNVLIIDDAVGSGATLHEVAKKIKEQLNPTGKIIGFAIVGSMKGFEVIREI